MRIPFAESQILMVLWEEGPLPAAELAAKAAARQGCAEATVKTLITRLLRRKALRSEKFEGRHVRYVPILQRADYLRDESRALIDRLFDGQLALLVDHLVSQSPAPEDDLLALRQVLADKALEDQPNH